MKPSYIIAIFLLCVTISYSQEKYSLFKPTPKSELRDFNTDRPDVTESPISVDAGHFQFEGDFYKTTRDTRFATSNTINYWNGLYKIGITSKIDFQLGIEAYNVYENPEGDKSQNGFGNTLLRVKYNFYGNDGGRSALGTIVYATLPTSKPDKYASYGINFPFAYDLNERFSLGIQPQFDFTPDDAGNYGLSYLQTINIAGNLIGNLDFFVELMGRTGSIATYNFNSGLIFNVSPFVKLDVAGNWGLNNESYTNFYTGLSFKI